MTHNQSFTNKPHHHQHYSCLKVKIRKPNLMKEVLGGEPSSGCFSMLKQHISRQQPPLLSHTSFTSDDLFYGNPLSLSPIKPSTHTYNESDESLLLRGDFLERGLKELEEMKNDLDATRKIIAVNEEWDRQIQEYQQQTQVQYSKQEREEIIKDHFGSGIEHMLNISGNQSSYSDYCKYMNDEYLKREIAKFFLIDLDLMKDFVNQIPELNKSKVDSVTSMKSLLEKMGIHFSVAGNCKDIFEQSIAVPGEIMKCIIFNMEKCLQFIDSKVDEFTEEELFESIVFMVRLYLSIKILPMESLYIVDVLSFGKILSILHKLLEKMEQTFPSIQERMLLSILQFLQLEKLDTANVYTLIDTFFTPHFSNFLCSRVWSHHSLLVNNLFKNLLLIILTRVTNNPMEISQIINADTNKQTEIFLKAMEFTNKTLAQEMKSCSFEHIYMIYNMYYLLVACFSPRNYNTLPLLGIHNNKELVDKCTTHFKELCNHLKRVIGFEYNILIGMRFEVFFSSLLPPTDDIL